MGFKDELKLHLSTINADRLHPGMNRALWKLPVPITPPNPNYKIKTTVSNIILPNSYVKIGAERGNNIGAFVYGDGPNFDVHEAVAQGNVVKFEIQQPTPNMSWQELLTATNKGLKKELEKLEAANGGMMRWKPIFRYDADTFHTLSIHLTDYSRPDPTLELGGLTPADVIFEGLRPMQTLATDPSDATENNQEWESDHEPYVYPPPDAPTLGDFLNLTEEERQQLVAAARTSINKSVFTNRAHGYNRHWKLLTQADLTSLAASDLRLANALGWPRSEEAPRVGLVTPEDEFGLFLEQGVVRAHRSPDMLATRFIKLESNLKTNAIDPVTKALKNVMAVVPVTQQDGDAHSLYYIGSVQNPHYTTLATNALDHIDISLFDDHDNPMNMRADWYVEITIRFDESEGTDMYRGTAQLTVPALAHDRYDPDGYRRLNSEILGNLMDLEAMEVEERTNNYIRMKHPGVY